MFDNDTLSKKKFARLLNTAIAVLVFVILLWIFFPMKTIIVPAGFSGVPIDNPWFFGKEGVRAETKSPGRHWEWTTTNYEMVPSTPIKQPVHIDDFTTADNYRVDFLSSVIIMIDDAPVIVDKWTLKFWTTSIVNEYMMIARQAVKPYTLIQLMGDTAKINDIDAEVTKKLREFVIERKIPITIVGIALGQAKPNKIVFDQIEETARVVEEKRTYTEKAAAETQRKESETNRAAADNAYRNALGMNTTEYVTLQVTKMQTEACIKAAQCFIGIEKIATSRSK